MKHRNERAAQSAPNDYQPRHGSPQNGALVRWIGSPRTIGRIIEVAGDAVTVQSVGTGGDTYEDICHGGEFAQSWELI